MNELPTRPAPRILRAVEAQQWIDGFAFLHAAREEAERVRRDAAGGLQQARVEGFEAARQEGDRQVIERLTRTNAQVDRYLAGLESALVDLTLGVVREVLGDLDDTERLLCCTRKALHAFRQDQQLTLFVPASELEAVRERVSIDLAKLLIESDAQLAPGQARLGGPVGWVEVGLDAQLQNIRRSLLPFAGEIAP